MPPLIEYCLDNVDRSTRDHLRSLDSLVQERQCLQRCGTCQRSPFLVVDGNPVTATNHKTLLDENGLNYGDGR